MSYTNVTIPNLWSSTRTYQKRIRELELQLEISNDTIRELDKILYNIPEAIKDYGYVDIRNDDGKLLCTLVQKPIEKNED